MILLLAGIVAVVIGILGLTKTLSLVVVSVTALVAGLLLMAARWVRTP